MGTICKKDIKVQVSKSGRVIRFDILATLAQPAQTILFDFKTGEKTSPKGNVVKNVARFFTGITLENVEFVGEKVEVLEQLFEFIVNHRSDYPIRQVNTILNRLHMFSPVEQIISAGCTMNDRATKGVLSKSSQHGFIWDSLTKNIKNLFYEYLNLLDSKDSYNYMYRFNPSMLATSYFINPDNDWIDFDRIRQIDEILQVVPYSEILEYGVLGRNEIQNEYSQNIADWLVMFNDLVQNNGYNAKTLWSRLKDYKIYEALNPNSYVLRMLKDTHELMSLYKRNPSRYPRMLESMHRIAIQNADFARLLGNEPVDYARDSYISMSVDGFIITPADNSKELLKEGISLHHCVPVYHKRIMNKKSDVYFMRYSWSPNDSLITMEVDLTKSSRPVINHARGLQNRVPNSEELDAINAFAKFYGFDVSQDL